MSLLSLPPELLFLIASYLSRPSLNSFLQASRYLHAVLTIALEKTLTPSEVSSLLWWAAEKDILPTITLALRRGASVDHSPPRSHISDSPRPTALIIAARKGHHDAVKLLLDYGADLEAKSNFSRTALHFCAHAGYMDVSETLLRCGADIDATDDDGASPLFLAAQKGHLEVMEMLLEKGADVAMCCERGGGTPLHTAAGNGFLEAVEMLLCWGAGPNHRDGYERTPLHRAMEKRQRDVVMVLVKQGGDLEARDMCGKAVTEYAHKEDMEWVEVLMLGRKKKAWGNRRK